MFLKTSKFSKPQERGLYAFTQYRRGDFLLFLKECPSSALEFMQLPDRYTLSLTIDEFSKGIEEGLLDFVEQIPTDVFHVAVENRLDFENFS